jgi:hypothetical protein
MQSDLPSVPPITVSVVVPVYSGAEYLAALIAEIERVRTGWSDGAAPLRLVEAILVDDAAVDSSPAMLNATRQEASRRAIDLTVIGVPASAAAGVDSAVTRTSAGLETTVTRPVVARMLFAAVCGSASSFSSPVAIDSAATIAVRSCVM